MNKYIEIAIFIKTFFRDEALYGCVDSIKKYCKDVSYRIYIADDGEINEKKKVFYDDLRKEGHFILELPFNTGASQSRNLLLQNLKDEKYILRLDDDFYFCEKTNLPSMKHILEKNPALGGVADLELQKGVGKGVLSGQISTWQGFMNVRQNKLFVKLMPLKKFNYCTIDGIDYAKCDYSRNMILLRREVFNDIQWDERFKFGGEHQDFLLQFKYSNWDLAFTTSSVHLHREDIRYNQNFEQYRNIRKENSNNKIQLLTEKWGINKVVIKRSIQDKIMAGLSRIVKEVNLK